MPTADVAASFQEAVCDVLSAKAIDACQATGATDLLIGGGVAANRRLRALLAERAAAAGIRLRTPRPALCTDNGAMIAALGAAVVTAGTAPSPPDIGADSRCRSVASACDATRDAPARHPGRRRGAGRRGRATPTRTAWPRRPRCGRGSHRTWPPPR